ncbi:MAG: hypothetical protein JWP75_3576 [Frondihabitans sp.]|nr:hypothetical protein [Frondihabitans sp.]
MSTLPEAPRPTTTRQRATDAFLALGRPLLRISFALYQLEVRRNLYPRDALVDTVYGPDPERLLFVGDVAASGHGVLSHGLTVASRTAAIMAGESGRGMSWSVIAETNLTLAALLARPRLGAEGVEVAFVLLGIPDVLLITRSEDWARDLALLARRIQDESGRGSSGCRVLVAGVPPLSDFRPISATLRRIITKQVDRLNAVSSDVATSTPGLTFVPFPAWRIGDMYIKQLFSWKALHETWAQSLAAAVAGGAAGGKPKE